MRVGIVAEQLRQRVPGGIGTYASGLLNGLVELADPSIELLAIASRPKGDDLISRPGLEVASSVLGHRQLMLAWDVGLAAPRGLDHLHLCSLAGPRQPSSVMVHDLGWRRHPELTTRRGARWHEAALRRAMASKAALIVPSAPVAADLEDAGADAARIVVIGEGADHLPAPDAPAARQLLEGLTIEGPFILTVSTLEPRKNLERLALAVERSRTGLPLVVVGPSGWGERKPLPGARLAGSVDGATLAGLYQACSLFAYVPVHEGFGLPPLEAMAQGAAVLVSDAVPSMAGAPAMERVDASSIDAIASSIDAAMADDARRSAAGAAGRTFADAHRWRDVAERHVALWRSGS